MVKRIVRTLVLAAAVLSGVAASLARAQFMSMGGGNDVVPDLVTRRGVAGYAKVLGLSDDQKQAALVLLDGTKTEYRKRMKSFQDSMKELQAKVAEDHDYTVYQTKLPDMIADLRDNVESLQTHFFDDLKSLCTPEQQDRWDALERYRRREQLMRVSFVSGAAADVSTIVDRTGVGADNKEVGELVTQYELDIDKPLRELQRMQDEQSKGAREKMEQWTKNPQAAMEEANKMMQTAFEVGTSMRTVNNDYARRLEAALSEEDRAKFEAEFNRRSFPRIYRESYPAKAMSAALAMPDLSEEERQAVQALRDSYGRDAGAINDRWAKAVRQAEDENAGSLARMMGRFQGNDTESADEKDARKARGELDEKTTDRLKTVLSAGHVAKLPEKQVDSMQPWQEMVADPSELVDEDN